MKRTAYVLLGNLLWHCHSFASVKMTPSEENINRFISQIRQTMYYFNFWQCCWDLIFLKSYERLTMLRQLSMVSGGFVGHSGCQTQPSSEDEWLLGLHVECDCKFSSVWNLHLNYLFMYALNLCNPYYIHRSKTLLWHTEYSFLQNFSEGRMNR